MISPVILTAQKRQTTYWKFKRILWLLFQQSSENRLTTECHNVRRRHSIRLTTVMFRGTPCTLQTIIPSNQFKAWQSLFCVKNQSSERETPRSVSIEILEILDLKHYYFNNRLIPLFWIDEYKICRTSLHNYKWPFIQR